MKGSERACWRGEVCMIRNVYVVMCRSGGMSIDSVLGV